MIIFLGNLPAIATEQDLHDLARLDGATRARIYKKQDGKGGLHRYGLVYLKTDNDGRKLIQRLQGAVCRGQTLEVREFGHRSASNERRRLDWREVSWDGPERRQRERRTADNY